VAELENAALAEKSHNRGFFGKLINGDFGLAKTFWLYGVLLEIIVISLATPKPYVSIFIALMLVNDAYLIVLVIGIWRAANKYQGLKIWGWLAKIVVVLGVALTLNQIFKVLFYFTAMSITGRP
jgi:hypothetical protein